MRHESTRKEDTKEEGDDRRFERNERGGWVMTHERTGEDWITEEETEDEEEGDEDDRRYERNGEKWERGWLGDRVSGCDFVSELGLVCLYT